MIFLPNFYERYLSALRCSIQYLIDKRGIKPKYIEMLRKIYIAEAEFSTEMLPVDIDEFTRNILTAVYIKKINNSKNFSFTVDLCGNCLLNPKLYTVLLLSIADNSRRISVSGKKGRLVIRSQEIVDDKDKISLCPLNSYYFKGQGEMIFVIPTDVTGKTKAKTNNIWDYLANPFSEVNVLIN